MRNHALALINFVCAEVGVVTDVGLTDFVSGSRAQEVSTARAENISGGKSGGRIASQLHKHSPARRVRDGSSHRLSPGVNNHAVCLHILERHQLPHAMKRMATGGNGLALGWNTSASQNCGERFAASGTVRNRPS